MSDILVVLFVLDIMTGAFAAISLLPIEPALKRDHFRTMCVLILIAWINAYAVFLLGKH